MKDKKLSIIDLLVIVAVVCVLSSILFPVFAQARAAQKKASSDNLKKIIKAAERYSQDYDNFFPIVINGRYRDLRNVDDGQLTEYGEQRSDQWPLLVLPYLKDRTLYIDPERGDHYNIWSGPPLATTDAGYNPLANTWRNQNRFPMYGMNYLFLSPMVIPLSRITDDTPTDYMVGEGHSFSEADDPNKTVFYTESNRGYVPTTTTDAVGTLDSLRGFFGINSPGLWQYFGSSTTPYVAFWTGTACSADWCGTDLDPTTFGKQTNEGFMYKNVPLQGNNVAYVDGHITFRTEAQLADGTDYLTATPNGPLDGGGAMITDKRLYLWNLNTNFYGL